MSADRPKLEKRPPDPDPPAWAIDPEGLLTSRTLSVKAALTGGIASGKSAAGELLAAFGAGRIDYDELCRRVVAKGSPGLSEAAELLGPEIVKPDGEMDRAKVAKIIFKDEAKRRALEAVIHPAAWRLMLEDLKAMPPAPLVVIEVPLLFEAALDSLFSPVILSFAKPETQYKRLRSRDGLGRWAAKRRLAAQLPMTEKLRRAGIVLDNDGSLAKTIRQAKILYDRLTSPDFKPHGKTLARSPAGSPFGSPLESPADSGQGAFSKYSQGFCPSSCQGPLASSLPGLDEESSRQLSSGSPPASEPSPSSGPTPSSGTGPTPES